MSIVDLAKHTLEEQSVPLNKEILVKMIEDLSGDEELIWNIVDGCKKTIGRIGLWSEILSTFNNPQRCESLISNLNEEQLLDFSGLLVGLKKAVEYDDYLMACNALMKIEPSTPESIRKAAELLDEIRKKDDVDLQSIAMDILQLTKHLRLLGGIFFNFQSKKDDAQWPINLGQMPEEDFDHLISLTKSLINSRT